MSDNTFRNDKKIQKMPKAFLDEQTPYRKKDFPKFIKVACCSYLPFTSCFRVCKVIVLGDVHVGKTSLVNRFCHQMFSRNYKATIGVDFEVEQFDILNVPFNMQIWDTAGQERFKCIASAYYRSAHAILTVFDFTNKSSLNHCPTWLGEALDANIDTPLKFLVGTKKDLMTSSEYVAMEASAVNLAKTMCAEYWAVSSKTGQDVSSLFQRVAALCFEESVKADLEMSERSCQFKLGSAKGVICLPQNNEDTVLRKRHANCEAKVFHCSRQ